MTGKKGGRDVDDDRYWPKRWYIWNLTHCRQLILFLISRDESDEESEEEKEEGWGKKKAYWSGDTADLEIGQDVQDAEDEEEAAEVRTSHHECCSSWHEAEEIASDFLI